MITIIAGEFRNRRLKTPPGTRTRPTAGRVREAWFNILQRAVPGARVLDLFAGSGALGLEALSRGAHSADFVETHRAALSVLGVNLKALKVEDRTAIYRVDAIRFAEQLAPRAYDVAFADPPYASDGILYLVALFRRTPFAKIFSLEHGADHPVPGDDTRRYGDTAITFLYAP